MFNKKEMKLMEFKKAKQKLHYGERVFMVQMDNSLVELTETTDWKTILFHNINGGNYAVYRKKPLENFQKEIRIGKKVYKVEHTVEGGDNEWKFASYKESK